MVSEVQIRIRYSEEPSKRDWETLARFLVVLRDSQPLMDLSDLVIWIIPEGMREAEQKANQLRMLPILKTLDDEFPMWHFADGSDSEG